MTRLTTHTLCATIATLACILAIAPRALALPILSVDTDPLTDGIQADRTVFLGDVFDIEIVITDVETSDPLHAYELDLGFDPSVIAALALTPGPFLAAPTFELENAIGADAVLYAVTRIGPAGAAGEGVLLSLHFDTRGLGTSVLDLSSVLLSAPDGRPIFDFDVLDGSITVVDGSNPIPEPGSVLLLVCGAAVVAGAVLRQGISF